jgi:hypothetical protein
MGNILLPIRNGRASLSAARAARVSRRHARQTRGLSMSFRRNEILQAYDATYYSNACGITVVINYKFRKISN